MNHLTKASLEVVLAGLLGDPPRGSPDSMSLELLPHLLDCLSCELIARKIALSLRPETRITLYPEPDCPGDAALQSYILKPLMFSASEIASHLQACLWCALASHDFTVQAGKGIESRVEVPEKVIALCTKSIATLHRSRAAGTRHQSQWPTRLLDFNPRWSIPLEQVPRAGRFAPPLTSRLPVYRLIPLVILQGLLPVFCSDGKSIRYRLFWSEGGRFLHDDEVLPAAGVQEGHHLSLMPEIGEPSQS